MHRLSTHLLSLLVILPAILSPLSGCRGSTDYDVILRGGTLYDGSGESPVVADLAVNSDTIAAIGDLSGATARMDLDVSGYAVSPGFINMLSWATTSLIADGRSMSDIVQGVTLEIFGEGWSEGPLNQRMKEEETQAQSLIKFDIDWTTLGEYLESLERRGISPNVASFVGATTVRIHEIGYDDRPPTPDELERMKALVRTAMEEGALGLGSSLIYAPAFYANTDELIELAKVAAEYDGMYISHMRSEGNQLLESLDELITISRQAGIRAEIYHLKAAGKENWSKLEQLLERIESVRAEGLEITADMYTYPAGATGLNAAMPPWVQEGGYGEWRRKLMDPQIQRPWMSFGSDAGSQIPEGNFLKTNPHPRAYGNFARLLGKYVREQQLIPLEEAIRRLTSLPAENLRIERRGKLLTGFFADITVFDPVTISDHATFKEPHQLSTGVEHVFVNGTAVLLRGEHTDARPGRFVRRARTEQ